ncbi:MAG: HPF/RaiA family ribosome-associated protein [Bacteroidales bacterium]|jgi:ribosome-associated translation inhibitor RaiA|nr:HPF/RaiA family ribosome-associated protein [Bacteroidales bacterium]
METIINTVKFRADQKLVDHINKRTGKIAKVLPQAVSTEVSLKIDREHEVNNKIVSVRIAIPGNDLFAEKQRDTFEDAFDDSMDAIRKMIEKIKDKYHN